MGFGFFGKLGCINHPFKKIPKCLPQAHIFVPHDHTVLGTSDT